MEDIKDYRKFILEHPFFVNEFTSKTMQNVCQIVLLLIVQILTKVDGIMQKDEKIERNNIRKSIKFMQYISLKVFKY